MHSSCSGPGIGNEGSSSSVGCRTRGVFKGVVGRPLSRWVSFSPRAFKERAVLRAETALMTPSKAFLRPSTTQVDEVLFIDRAPSGVLGRTGVEFIVKVVKGIAYIIRMQGQESCGRNNRWRWQGNKNVVDGLRL